MRGIFIAFILGIFLYSCSNEEPISREPVLSQVDIKYSITNCLGDF